MWSSLLAAGLTATASLVLAQSDIPLSSGLQDILANAPADPKYDYPTSLTRQIVPKNLHSHNDYWREVPFYTALSVGAISVEADVWFYPDVSGSTLFVGHEPGALTAERTFDSLYVQPILSVLRAQNPDGGPFAAGAATRNGVFDTSPGQTLYLFVDVKTDGAATWPLVTRALQPLRDAGYLATAAGGSAVAAGPVTVVGTGNTPLGQVQGVSPRDYFYDAPVAALGTAFGNITSDVSPVASADFAAQFGDVRSGAGLDAAQLALLRAQVATAHARGIKVRYWDQPGWPVGTRNAVWRTLWENGADLINVDDLEGAANFWENLG